ncbi:hypothetical protein APSETT444_010574 [Aspergillus pseudonomiae]
MESVQVDSPEPELQTPRLLLKLISAGFAFYVAGVNDGSLGALIPYIREAYDIDTNMVSIVYGTTFCGWLVAALSNSHLSRYLDLGVFLVMGATLQVLAHALRAWLPPLPLFAVTFFIASLGQAYQDTYANTFVASVKAAHRWLGFIHAMYMAGCLTGPFIATAVASAGAQSRWELFYTAPLGLGVINFVLVVIAFQESLTFKRPTQGEMSSQDARQKSPMQEIKKTLTQPGVWILSLYFFFFLGAVITAGGWIVEYLVHVRDGDLKDMGYVPAGFYGGGFLGRLILAEPTYRLGERRMVFIYVLLSFIFVLGQVGGAVFPAVTGVMAAKVGVSVLQPMLVGLLGATGVSWLMLPKSRLHHD